MKKSVCVCVGGVQGAADERVCDVGRPAGLMSHWQKERNDTHSHKPADKRKVGPFRLQIMPEKMMATRPFQDSP